MNNIAIIDTFVEVYILPFLSNKKQQAGVTGVMIKERTPDTPEQEPEYDHGAGIEACAQDLIDAVHAKDTQKVAQVLKDAFELLESQPHEEGPHIEEGQE